MQHRITAYMQSHFKYTIGGICVYGNVLYTLTDGSRSLDGWFWSVYLLGTFHAEGKQKAMSCNWLILRRIPGTDAIYWLGTGKPV